MNQINVQELKNSLTQVKELISILNNNNLNEKNEIFYPINNYVIVRTYSAGVHFGILKECEGKILKLSDSRRIWKWSGAFTLSEIANNGFDKDSKISEEIPEIILTEAIEIIKCSEKSIKIIKNFPVYIPG